MVKNKRGIFFVRSETIVSCAVCILFGLLKKLGCERPLVFERGYFLHDFFSRLFALYIFSVSLLFSSCSSSCMFKGIFPDLGEMEEEREGRDFFKRSDFAGQKRLFFAHLWRT